MNCKISTRGVTVNGLSLNVSETPVHPGHHISTKDTECGANAAKNRFWKFFYLFICDYSHICSSLKNDLFRQCCCNYYESPLWLLQSDGIESLCVAWRKSLKIIWRVRPQTHCDGIAALSSRKSFILSLRPRFVNLL